MSEVKHHIPHGYLWLDLETTGLDPSKDEVLEMAWAFLKPEEMWHLSVDEFSERVSSVLFKPSKEAKFDLFVAHMHGQSGLLQDLYDTSQIKQPQDFISFFWERVRGEWPAAKHEQVVLAGSSVAFDRDFLFAGSKSLRAFLSHRVLDVSSLSLFCRSMGMKPAENQDGGPKHRAKDDIVASYRIGLECQAWLLSRDRLITF